MALPETTLMQCLQMTASRDTVARLQNEAKPIVLAITVQKMVAVAPTGEQGPFAIPSRASVPIQYMRGRDLIDAGKLESLPGQATSPRHGQTCQQRTGDVLPVKVWTSAAYSTLCEPQHAANNSRSRLLAKIARRHACCRIKVPWYLDLAGT